MKFAIKSIVAAAAFAAVGVASAASVSVIADGTTLQGPGSAFTVTGSGQLQFSKNLASALSLGAATVGAYGAGGTVTPVTVVVPPTTPGGKSTSYKTYNIGAGIAGLTFDNTTGKVQTVLSTGGTTQALVNEAANADISAIGGTANIGDLDVRFQADGSVKIFGKIVGSTLDGSANVNWTGELFNVTAANVSGATTFAFAAGTYNTTLKNLAITTTGFDQLATVFGLDNTGLGYTSLQSAAGNFGTLTSAITVTAVIPEPSTYALMGLGLIGLSLVARRRAK